MREGSLLNYLGIQQWYPCKLKHPWYSGDKIIVDVLPAIFQVKCMVLLPVKKGCAELCDPIAKKILTGMLGVLHLTHEELSIATIYTADEHITMQDWQQAFVDIAYWQPKFILQLDKTMPLCRDNKTLIQTYHPAHLAQNQQDKVAAYQDLLTLKDRLYSNDYLT